MLSRKIGAEFEAFLKGNVKESLLVTGARRVGKTVSIRDFAMRNSKDFVEISFIERPEAKALCDRTRGTTDFFNRFSAFVGRSLTVGQTLVFFDEVQECPEIVTFIKFLGDDARYRYVLSGLLLGVEMKDIRSAPESNTIARSEWTLSRGRISAKCVEVEVDLPPHLSTFFSLYHG